MYMPGRSRTGCRPLRTGMSFAVYREGPVARLLAAVDRVDLVVDRVDLAAVRDDALVVDLAGLNARAPRGDLRLGEARSTRARTRKSAGQRAEMTPFTVPDECDDDGAL